MIDPIFRWLFIDMMMAALSRLSMGHRHILASGKAFGKIPEISFLNMLYNFLAANEINAGKYRPLR